MVATIGHSWPLNLRRPHEPLQLVPRDTPRPAHLIRVAVPRLNKQDQIGEYLAQLTARDYDLEWAQVDETKALSCADWNALMNSLLEDREWLAGKGGTSSWNSHDGRDWLTLSPAEQEQWKRGAFIHVVAVQCAGQTVYLDPQGYDYARYVAFAADGLPEGLTRQERERERVKAEQAKISADRAIRIANPPAVPADHGLRFLWNGIKVAGKLYRAWYSLGNTHHYPEGTITISARDYISFPPEVAACFHVENNTDSQSDYFDSDRLRICQNHPLYGLALIGLTAHDAHFSKLSAKRKR